MFENEPKLSGVSSLPKQPVEKVEVTDLPTRYGDTRIVLLPRDPLWIFTYWEISLQKQEEIKRQYGTEVFEKGKIVIRVYDITDINFNGTNAHTYFDVTVNPFADNWYINVGTPNRSYCVDLGLVTRDGKFIVIVRSNTINMPRQGVSTITDEQWAILQTEFEQLLKLSGIEQVGRSSFDVARLMAERWRDIISVSSLTAGSVGISSFGKLFPSEEERKEKDFWLKANTELIVYGTTETDAKLTVDEKEVKLNPDGSFSLRFMLGDGERNIPIEAVSKDGTMSRMISFKVIKETK